MAGAKADPRRKPDMKAALLTDRAVIHVAGEDSRSFLNGILTANVATLEPGEARPFALLTPQGKMIADGLIVAVPPDAGDGFLLDVPLAPGPDLVKKLGFYRLRANVTIADKTEEIRPLVVWDTLIDPGIDPGGRDTRHAGLGFRAYLDPSAAAQAAGEIGADLAEPASFHAHRIALAIPEGGKDYMFGDTFPHEANMDQLGGIDFRKGCYVGQEVVSRMQHRSTTRTRVMPVAFPDGFAAMEGTEIRVGDKPAGTMGTSVGDRGLALVRLDRLADALAERQPMTAGGVDFVLCDKPDWAAFDWPGQGPLKSPA
jgi:tRNA-modifying protein YgfZ